MAETAQPEAHQSEMPKLSAADFRAYNRMAQHMNQFHSSFRATWKMLYASCSSGKRPANMSLRQFISTAEQFLHHLEMHHSIEERHIFPVLAVRMPAFRTELELLTQHKQIHAGMEKLEAYLGQCRSGEKDLRMEQMKEIMDSFGDVLWSHLDDEVKELGAENMRKYWTIEELRRMPM